MTVGAREPSAVEWLGRLRRRELSSRELVDRQLEGLAAADARLSAVVTLDVEGARQAANAADAARARGDDRPLLGLPVTIKDSLEVAGLPATGGSLARAEHVPARDATVVARLRAAGAVVVAKTNVPEYSCAYETANLVRGRTVHPLDATRTPGGSSGGEAALVAVGASLLGIGTDGGGSIRVPAHYCGVVGLRPTTGRVPDTGNWPGTRASGYMDFYCVGPIARHVDDAALVLPLIAGPDGVDPYALPAPLGEADAVELDGLRVGWSADAPADDLTPGTRTAVAAAVSALEQAGASVQELELPWEPNPTDLFFAAISADGGAQMRADLAPAAGRHDPGIVALLDAMAERALDAAEWFELQRDVFAYRSAIRSLLTDRDVLICPVTAGPAPCHGERPGLRPHDPSFSAYDHAHLVAVAGIPAATVPAGVEAGLPVGVQLAAAPWREDVALAAARVVEAAFREAGSSAGSAAAEVAP